MDNAQSLPIESRLVRRLLNGGFGLSAEMVPPISGSRDDVLKKIAGLKDYVDAINIADSAGARVHMSGLACAAIFKAEGVEPVLQIICRDRNKLAMFSDLLGAGALGINNILIMRGDDLAAGDQPDATAVHDLKPSELIEIASTLTNQGLLPLGGTHLTETGILPQQKEIPSPPQFFIGAADLPTSVDEDWWAKAFKEKLSAGANFIQTQLCYDKELITHYGQNLNDQGFADHIFVLIGTGPIASVKSALWMKENLYGVAMPDEIIQRLSDAKDEKAEGIKICAELLQHISDTPGLSGAHIMAPGNSRAIPEAIEMAGLDARGEQSA